MEKLVDDGLVKSIGISNFSCKKIDTLLAYARIKPVAVQVEVHPYFRNQKLVDHCKSKVPLLFCHAPVYTQQNILHDHALRVPWGQIEVKQVCLGVF